MYRRMWLSSMILLLTVGSAAAERPAGGFKGGLSLADQTWTYTSDLGTVEKDTRSGLAFGAFMDIDVTPLLGIRPEILYVQKGNQVEVRVIDYAGNFEDWRTYKDRIDYFSVCLTGRFKPHLFSQLDLYFLAGPRMDIKVGSSSDMSEQEAEIILDSYKDVVPGATFGIGMERKVGPALTVLIEGRYDLDFGDAMVFNPSTHKLTIENSAILLLAGVRF